MAARVSVRRGGRALGLVKFLALQGLKAACLESLRRMLFEVEDLLKQSECMILSPVPSRKTQVQSAVRFLS